MRAAADELLFGCAASALRTAWRCSTRHLALATPNARLHEGMAELLSAFIVDEDSSVADDCVPDDTAELADDAGMRPSICSVC